MQATTISLLDPASVADDGIIRERLPVPLAWTARDLTRDDWLVPLPPECVAELRAVVADLRANPLPTIVLEPDDYELSACRELAERLRQRFHSGMGIAVLDRLPLDELDREEATACYWLLGRLLARPVAQAFDGRLLYDVRDVGRRRWVAVAGPLAGALVALALAPAALALPSPADDLALPLAGLLAVGHLAGLLPFFSDGRHLWAAGS